MNIYIYGSKSFRNDVHDELDHSNIKFRLDDESAIVDLKTLDDLKRAIEINPDDVFLIDDDKIIKKEGLHTKFKFLKPKDGIEDSFLFDHGIGDISFDSITELSKHIIQKIEAKKNETAEAFEDRNEIQDSIANIVQEAFDEESNEDETIELDEELSQLLSSNEPLPQNIVASEDDFEQEKEEDVPLMTFSDIMKEEKGQDTLDELDINNDDFSDFNFENSLDEQKPVALESEDSMDLDLNDFENELDKIDISNNDFLDDKDLNEFTKVDVQTQNVQDVQGDFNMAGDVSSLDQISEKDIMAALNGEEISLSNNQVLSTPSNSESSENMTLNLQNADDISALLNQLLQNKTLEITVKVKD